LTFSALVAEAMQGSKDEGLQISSTIDEKVGVSQTPEEEDLDLVQ
jgi:hypothetical protein